MAPQQQGTAVPVASSSRKSIPVPRDASRRTDGAQQPPWRSSLDLVWSYSRSQAFYGDNIATSPSFVERHWAGREISTDDDTTSNSIAGESSSFDSQSEDYDDEDEDDEEYNDDDYNRRRRGPDYRDDVEAAQWDDQHLPPNAVQRGRRRASGQQRTGAAAASRPSSTISSTTPAVLRDPFADDGEATPLMANGGSARHRQSYLSVPGGGDDDDKQQKLPQRTATGSSSLSTSSSSFITSAIETDLNPLNDGRGRIGGGGGRRRSSASHRTLHGQGSSTFLQSWFNTVNALVGVGILALPLAFSYAGWIGGTLMFLVCGALTNYTGKVLAHIMSREPSLRTYADIGSYAFGPRARWVVSAFFCLELWAVSVALIILFGDSMAAIFPSVASSVFKAVGFAIVLPTVFLPLRWLSPISVVGIISTVTLVVVVVSDGLYKTSPPGSILHPAPGQTRLGPRWDKVPLSFGLIMSGFSSHPVIPSLVKDMRNPRDFNRMLNLAYLAATALYLTMGMAGYAMFGEGVSDEITRDLARTPGFPVWLNAGAIWLIVVNPLANFALATRPIQTTLETLLGIEAGASPVPSEGAMVPPPPPTGVGAGTGSSTLEPAEDGITTTAPTSQHHHDATTVGLSTKPTPSPSPSPSPPSLHPSRSPSSQRRRTTLLLLLTRLLLTSLITLTAILLPGFEKVMAFLGAFLAFTTCILGPLLANLVLHRRQMGWLRVGMDLGVLMSSAAVAATATVWSFL